MIDRAPKSIGRRPRVASTPTEAVEWPRWRGTDIKAPPTSAASGEEGTEEAGNLPPRLDGSTNSRRAARATATTPHTSIYQRGVTVSPPPPSRQPPGHRPISCSRSVPSLGQWNLCLEHLVIEGATRCVEGLRGNFGIGPSLVCPAGGPEKIRSFFRSVPHLTTR